MLALRLRLQRDIRLQLGNALVKGKGTNSIQRASEERIFMIANSCFNIWCPSQYPNKVMPLSDSGTFVIVVIPSR